ncbi:MAG: hypothetical protein NVS3B10_21390 [Polyangiales bacterium]
MTVHRGESADGKKQRPVPGSPPKRGESGKGHPLAARGEEPSRTAGSDGDALGANSRGSDAEVPIDPQPAKIKGHEKDQGFNESHGYPAGHGGPTSPGDAPGGAPSPDAHDASRKGTRESHPDDR